MPDYELRLWDEDSFDVSSVPFAKEASESKKWAFVADYVRLYALYNEGGIYLDTDVRVFKRFDKFLKYNFFTSHEIHPGNFTVAEQSKLNDNDLPINDSEYIIGLNVLAAVMGGAKGLPFLKDCLDFYGKTHLLGHEGKLACEDLIIGPYISKIAEKYGYRYNSNEQKLDDDMIILRPDVFVGNSSFLTNESYANHICNGSWKERSPFGEVGYYIRNHYPEFSPALRLLDKIVRNVKALTQR